MTLIAIGFLIITSVLLGVATAIVSYFYALAHTKGTRAVDGERVWWIVWRAKFSVQQKGSITLYIPTRSLFMWAGVRWMMEGKW